MTLCYAPTISRHTSTGDGHLLCERDGGRRVVARG